MNFEPIDDPCSKCTAGTTAKKLAAEAYVLKAQLALLRERVNIVAGEMGAAAAGAEGNLASRVRGWAIELCTFCGKDDVI